MIDEIEVRVKLEKDNKKLRNVVNQLKIGSGRLRSKDVDSPSDFAKRFAAKNIFRKSVALISKFDDCKIFKRQSQEAHEKRMKYLNLTNKDQPASPRNK
jgi:hypothetical protein